MYPSQCSVELGACQYEQKGAIHSVLNECPKIVR